MSNDLCSHCSGRLDDQAVTLWDAQHYCRSCVEKIAPQWLVGLPSDELADVLDPKQVHGWHFIAYMWPRFMAVVLVIAALPWTIGIAQNGVDGLLVGLVVVGALGAFAFAFLGLQAMIGHFSFRWQLPRKVAVSNGKLNVSWRNKKEEYDLAGCKWYEGSTIVDNVEMFSQLRRGIVLQLPQGNVGIGHLPDTLDQWRAFLTLSRVPIRRPIGCLRMIGVAIVGLLGGAVIGVALGFIVAGLLQKPMWQLALGFQGGIDGLAAAMLYLTATSEHAAAARKRLHPLLLGGIFGLIGAKVGIFAGWPAALSCAAANGVIGLGLGWLCRRRIQQEELALESERQSR